MHADILFINRNFGFAVRAKVKVINRLCALCRAVGQPATLKDVSTYGRSSLQRHFKPPQHSQLASALA